MTTPHFRLSKNTTLVALLLGIIISLLSFSIAYATGNKASAQFQAQAGEFMTKATPTGLPLGASARTVEAWVKSTSVADQAILDMGHAAGGALHEYYFHILAGQLRLSLSGANVIWDIPGINDGNWHHLAVSYIGGTDNTSGMTAYMDGIVLSQSSSITAVPDTTGDAVRIGASLDNPAGTDLFNGNIEEVRVWNTARTGVQINSTMNTELSGLESGLVGYWNLDKNFDDETTNGNDLTSAFNFKHFKSNDTPF